ncbi:MAG: DUF1540 domain-containing protein [Bacillota bacterium]
MPSGIKCMVEECTHNSEKLCQADAIEVRSSGTREVSNTDETCCGTFKP